MRERGRRTALAALAACAMSAACATGPITREDPFGAPGPDEVLLTVHNNDIRPATIYAHWNGVKERVGMVSGTKSETFRMRWQHEEVRLEYELLGRRAVATGRDRRDGMTSAPVPVYRGDHLDLVIQPQG